MDNSENRTACGSIKNGVSGGTAIASEYMHMIQSGNPPRCECHECTQIRWKLSMQGQLQGAR